MSVTGTGADPKQLAAALGKWDLVGPTVFTVHWQAAGLSLDAMAKATSRFIDLLTRALTRHGHRTTGHSSMRAGRARAATFTYWHTFLLHWPSPLRDYRSAGSSGSPAAPIVRVSSVQTQ